MTQVTKNETEIILFNHEQFGEVRTIIKEDEYWFVASDVCRCLDLSNITEALRGVEDDEKDDFRISDVIGRKQATTIISESGLYTLIMRSNKPEAKSFRKWVTSEVLPSIRKHGKYSVGTDSFKMPTAEDFDKTPPIVMDALVKTVNSYQFEYDKRITLEHIIEESQPKIEFYDAVGKAKGRTTVYEMAQILCQNGLKVGGRELFKLLKEKGYHYKTNSKNTPVTKYVKQGIFEIGHHVINEKSTNPIFLYTPYITPKGVQYFVDKLLHANVVESAV
jgi:anti-repressor protein